MAIYINGKELDLSKEEDRKLLEETVERFQEESNREISKSLPKNASPMLRRWAAENEDIVDTGKL